MLLFSSFFTRLFNSCIPHAKGGGPKATTKAKPKQPLKPRVKPTRVAVAAAAVGRGVGHGVGGDRGGGSGGGSGGSSSSASKTRVRTSADFPDLPDLAGPARGLTPDYNCGKAKRSGLSRRQS